MAAFANRNAFENGAEPLKSDMTFAAAGPAATASIKRLKTGETLYMEGDRAPYCYQVVEGVMKEYNTLADGRRHVADFYSVGDLFGISDGGEHAHTAQAITDCAVLRHPRNAYLRSIAASPELSQQFLDILMTRLHRARQRLIMLGRMSAAQRVAAFLLRLSSEQQKTDKIQFVMSRQDIADHLGLTIETVSRVLTTFRNSRVIEMTNSRCFAIPDIDRLDEAAHGVKAIH